MNTPAYSVIPLGGIREIGKNMWLVSQGDEMIMVDAGLKFPSEDMYGVNHLLPDFSYVLEHQRQLKAVILTHAHEDHVGALVPLYEQLDHPPPLYASEMTIGLLGERVTDINPQYADLLQTIQPRERHQIGSFDVEFLHVCHSISGAIGLAIHTPDGAIVFTGDFKMDPTPIDQQPTDYFKFAQLGEDGVLLLISDSTNAANPGYTISEQEVAQGFRNAFYRAKGRIIIATFASSLHRIQQIVQRCEEFGRRVAFVGRSMERMTARAQELGYLKLPPGLELSHDEIDSLPPEKVAIVTTGSQGEPMAALSRMAAGRYNAVSIQAGDTVIISATPIPGNERSVYKNINLLLERGAEVLHESRLGLHASGHASQEELKLMLNLTRPRYFIPTHGEYRQMSRHADLAKATGVPADHIFLLDIGQRLSVSAAKAEVTEKIPSGVVMVAGHGTGYLEQKELRERHRLVKDGVLLVSLSVDVNGQPLGAPRLSSKGFIIDEDANLYEEVAERLLQAIEKQLEKWQGQDRVPTLKDTESWLNDHLSRIIQQKTRRKPVIIPLVHQLHPHLEDATEMTGEDEDV
ncbi:MAG: ribonuclease J [Candidatus Sericytochromatia bacterium]|nr:ribonuclease J [Candidatus Sericytochromatia bacterium]